MADPGWPNPGEGCGWLDLGANTFTFPLPFPREVRGGTEEDAMLPLEEVRSIQFWYLRSHTSSRRVFPPLLLALVCRLLADEGGGLKPPPPRLNPPVCGC
jgi:hypothetical protein